MVRRIAFGLLALAAILLLAALIAVTFLGRIDLASYVARRASAQLHRTVTIGHLHVVPGRWLRIAAQDIRVANLAGGSKRDMVAIGDAEGEIEAWSLLAGPALLRGVTATHATLLLEHTPGGKNWKFPEPGKARSSAGDPSPGLPTLLDAHLRDADIVFRTSGGTALRTRLTDLTLHGDTADQPIRVAATGSYNDIPVTLTGTLGSFTALRRTGQPFRSDIDLATGDTRIAFRGSMTDPANVEGAKGELTIASPHPAALMALAGAPAVVAPALDLAGGFTHDGNRWALDHGHGSLGGDIIKAASLRLDEGEAGKPDAIAADITFDKLDVGDLAAGLSQGGGKPAGSDIPFDFVSAPGTLVDAKLAAGRLVYGSFEATQAAIAVTLNPGTATVSAFSLGAYGGKLRGTGRIDSDAQGGKLTAGLDITGAAIATIGKALDFKTIPLAGRLDATVAASSQAKTLGAAFSGARITAVLSMSEGTLARKVIEMASTDVRLLFRDATGTAPVSCLLGVLDLQGSKGRLQPLRVRTAAGAIGGMARFDLARRRFILVIGSQSATTGAFALDVPLEIGGSFANPGVHPAALTKKGRAMLASAQAMPPLPAALDAAARKNACTIR